MIFTSVYPAFSILLDQGLSQAGAVRLCTGCLRTGCLCAGDDLYTSSLACFTGPTVDRNDFGVGIPRDGRRG